MPEFFTVIFVIKNKVSHHQDLPPDKHYYPDLWNIIQEHLIQVF